MANWNYGAEGTRYPVKVGDVWRIGSHVFVCSDLMESTLFDEVISDPTIGLKPSLLYCDPPWGQGLLNGFRTKAGLDKAEYRWEDLYRRLANIGHDRDIPVYVEGSVITHRDGEKIPASIVHPKMPESTVKYWRVKYYRKHPSGLYHSGRQPIPQQLLIPGTLDDVDDDFTPGIVMKAYGNTGVVIDPCAGRGQTSRQANSVGWASVNNELNPNRVSAALSRMAQLVGDPEKIR